VGLGAGPAPRFISRSNQTFASLQSRITRLRRDAEDVGRLLDAEAGEESELHHPHLAGIHARQGVERVVE